MQHPNAVVLAFAFALAVIDGVLKYFANQLPAETIASYPIGIALHRNPGIAFDIPVPLPLVLSITAVVVVLITVFIKKNWRALPHASTAGMVIILGAMGNALDRLYNNYTTDYLIFFGRSAINLSDILIVIGTIGFLYYTRTTSPTGAK